MERRVGSHKYYYMKDLCQNGEEESIEYQEKISQLITQLVSGAECYINGGRKML